MVAIIGGGVAGLAAAYSLHQNDIPFLLFEADERVGGKIRTECADGYLVEHGPNSLQTITPFLDEVIETLGLNEQRVFAAPEARKRFVVQRGEPTALPMSPPALLGTGLFSVRAKLRLLCEPFIGRNTGEEESVAAFVRRRLGQEILNYAVDPFVSGIFAGDPQKLSIEHAFPSLFQLESKHGSLFRGMVAGRKEKKDTGDRPERRISSFVAGMQALPEAMARCFSHNIRLKSRIAEIVNENEGWRLSVAGLAGTESIRSDAVICTIPLPALQKAGLHVRGDLSPFWRVSYPPVGVIAMGFRREDVDHPLDGFGMLAPGCESGTRILGTIFSSTVFPGRAPADHVLLTTLVGGARSGEMALLPKDVLQDIVLADLHNLLGVHGSPTFVRHITWEQAIPQFDLGFGAVKELLDRLENEYPGLHFAGNYRAGISVSDAMASGEAAARVVMRNL